MNPASISSDDRPQRNRYRRPRRAMTSLLAMLFLVLFVTLAVGFFAATTVSVQVAHNDVQTSSALAAAESGMNFMRYQLARLRIPYNTAADAVLEEIASQLDSNLEGTGNLGTSPISFDGTTIRIPAAESPDIPITEEAGRFRVAIFKSAAGRVAVKVTGQHTDQTIDRLVQLNFNTAPRNGIFDYAIASKGIISTSGSSRIYGQPDKTTANMLSADRSSANPIVVDGKEIGGDVSIVNAGANVQIKSGTVGGAGDLAEIEEKHVHKGVPDPEFPEIDLAVFTKFVSKPYTDSSVQSRAFEPADMRFASPMLARAVLPATADRGRRERLSPQGALLTQALFQAALRQASVPSARSFRRLPPLAFRGDSFIPGGGSFMLLAKKDDPDPSGGSSSGDSPVDAAASAAKDKGGGGTTYTNCYVPADANPTFNSKDILQGVLYIKAPNQVRFNGGCTIRGVIVVENNPELSPDRTVLDFRGNADFYGVETLDPAKFPELSRLTGTSIAAPNAKVEFGGNFGTVVSGSILAASISFSGSAGGSINGSIIGLNKDYPMSLSNSNSSPIIFVGTAKTNPPSGVKVSSYLTADPATYTEPAQ